jgi:peptidyl-dipeptidase Dcp
MKKPIVLVIVGGFMIFLFSGSTSRSVPSQESINPFFTEYDTPFKTPPFDKIENEHYLPAFTKGIKQHATEIQKITKNSADPTFENTIEALEKSGALLNKVSYVFFNMTSARTSDELQAIAKEISPQLTKHRDDIRLNAHLFKRIQKIYNQKEDLDLTIEQHMLLDEYYKEFVRGGANLADDKKAEFREINKELSLLSLEFGENVLKENNRFELVIEDEDDLSGLPNAVISAAAEAAAERDYDGKWVFTLHKPSLIPFLQYSTKRNLRQKMLIAYSKRGDNNDEFDNKNILKRMVSLRTRRAQLLGYPTHAHYVLEENMAKHPESVYKLLDQIWKPALEKAQQEAQELQELIGEEGESFKLKPWDWWYYAEKLKKAKYDLDDAELRPYFQMESVRQGVFDLASRLFGITFTVREDIPVYHDDVTVYELKNTDGSHIGILYTDYYPRASKRGGAWMNEYRIQSNINGEKISPIITNVGNFSKPTAEQPALLSLDETLTLFHEFGHALHGLLSECTYPKLAGTNVARDFVELPSQIMENWALEPEMLKSYARHYQTGEPIPDELIEKIKRSNKFNQGFATVEYLAAAYLDMDWHTLPDTVQRDPIEFENKSLAQIGLIPEIIVRYRSPYFSHIFSGGYSAGYYSYIWAEVLDADAFQAFKEAGIFDRQTAQSFRNNILARGGTEDPMTLYKRFRGFEPKIEPLLERRGLN